VFPIEWLLIENIRNIDLVKLDEETKLKIREIYKKFLKDEKK
jgi:hypothetical protein